MKRTHTCQVDASIVESTATQLFSSSMPKQLEASAQLWNRILITASTDVRYFASLLYIFTESHLIPEKVCCKLW